MNRKILIYLATIFSISTLISGQSSLIVKFKPAGNGETIESVINSTLMQSNVLNKIEYHYLFQHDKLSKLNDNIGLKRIYRFNFKNDEEKSGFLTKILSNSSVEYVQEPVNYKIDSAPNDSLFKEQWGIKKIGALKSLELIEDTGIELSDILVAIIDTGIDDDHPDLYANIYINTGETGIDNQGNDKKFNGIDDDNNGYVDDFKGFDFVDKSVQINFNSDNDYTDWDNLPSDEHGHGTNIAGIIAAQSNNKIGIAGLAPNIKILNLRAFDATGNGEDDDVASAIIYAVQAGAKIINMSFGDDKFSYLLRDAIKFAYDNGVVLVASSGNSASDRPHYPSSFPEVISVGASDENDYVASFSNSGSTIDLVAPGVSILTTTKDGSYGIVSGTSAAAPFVSGSATVLLGIKNFEIEEIKQILKSTATDINSTGWDLNAGAGRLNLFKAVSTLTPGIIKINSPAQDFATSSDSLQINLTVISPYFRSFELQYGVGYNPDKWQAINVDGRKQIFDENVASLDISELPDTVYTLRLIVNMTNENNQEERINFYVDRTAPEAYFVNGGTALIGKNITVMGSIYSKEQTKVKMFFRPKGNGSYDFVYLDQFSMNTGTVHTTHFGYIPLEKVQLNTTYQVYFEAENLAGLKTVIDNNGNPFEFELNDMVNLRSFTEKKYTLPPGRIFDAPVKLSSDKTSYVLLNPENNSGTMQIYKFSQDNFVLVDSLDNRIPKAAGDFNGNGKTDLLSLFLRNGYIDEQKEQGAPSFTTIFADSTGNFWPSIAEDLDADGKTEIISFSDSTFSIYEIQNDLSLIPEEEFGLPDETENGYLGAPNVAVCDLNGDGKNEIWFLTSKGVLNGYQINGKNSYAFFQRINLGLDGSRNIISSGDYDGDGWVEIAVLLKSVQNNDIAPFYLLIVFNLQNNQLNLLTTIAFVDAGSEISSGFTRKKYSIKFSDVNNDGKQELMVNTFPYFYVFEREQDNDILLFYTDKINTTNIFSGDLDGDGAREIGVNSVNKVEFFEISDNNLPEIPKITDFYSPDSNKAYISWKGNSGKYIIYKGLTDSTLSIFDTLAQNFLIDTVIPGTFTYYAVQSLENGSTSTLSDLISIYSHAPAKLSDAMAVSGNSLLVKFTEKVKNNLSVPDLFYINNSILPSSIIAASQYSYLLKFEGNLPPGSNVLHFKEFRDYYNAPVKADSFSFTVDLNGFEEKLFVENFKLTNENTLELKFNLPVDSKSAKKKENYSFTPKNGINGIKLNNGNKSVILNTKYPLKSIGKEYTLRIRNIKSSVETGNIQISDEAGSIIVLSSFEDDLSGVYTYPNPVNLSEVSSVMFAKLTRFAEITIFSIDGKKIVKLNENDGNGGLEWNLRDENGSKINSGIYIYIVKALDEENNEIDKKLGKIAVIK